MSQSVTRDFNEAYHRLINSKHGSREKRRFKRLAHHRERVAVREQLTRGDEPSHVATRHPMTGWDVV